MSAEDDRKLRTLVAALREVCAGLAGAEEYVMVHHPAFRVGKKPFAIAGLHVDRDAAALSVNFGPDEQLLLLDDERFSRTPYIGQHGWVSIAQRDLRKGELESLVVDSWRRIANKRQLAQRDALQSRGAPARSRRSHVAISPPAGAARRRVKTRQSGPTSTSKRRAAER